MADTTKMLPIKKLEDVGGNYYPLTTTETVVFAQECEVVNNIGAYKKGDKIYVGTSVKTVLENILGRPVAFNIITTTFDTLSDKTAPSSLLTKTEFDKKEKEIQENKAEIEDIKTDISQKFEKMNKTFDTEDNKYIKGFTQVDGQLTEIREDTFPDKSKVSIETVKQDGGISAILTIDGETHNIYVPNVDNEFGDEPSTENAASSKLVKDSLDTKQDTIVWRNDDYNEKTNKAVTENDLALSLVKVCHYQGEYASPESLYNPIDGDIITCGNYYYIYNATKKKWIQLNQNNDYIVHGEIQSKDIIDGTIEQIKIKDLPQDIKDCKEKSKVEISGLSTTGTAIATVTIDGKANVIKAPSVDTCVISSTDTSNIGEVVVFSNETGNGIKSSGKTLGVSVPSDAKFTDTTYSLATETSDGLLSAGDKKKLNEFDDVKSNVEINISDISNILIEVSNHSEKLAADGSNITALQSLTSTHTTTISQRETIDDHKADIKLITNRVDTLEGKVNDAVSDVDDAVSKITTYDERITDNSNDINSLSKDKQDKLKFITDYNSETNKVATQKDIEKLSGTTYFLGISTTEITDGGEEIPTIAEKRVEPENGDIVLYKNYEFIWSEELNAHGGWARFGAAGEFILKNSEAVTNADIKDAALSISKISGLQTSLDSKCNISDAVTITGDQSITGSKTFTNQIDVSKLVYTTNFVIYWKDGTGKLNEMMRFEKDKVYMGTFNSVSNPVIGFFSSANWS